MLFTFKTKVPPTFKIIPINLIFKLLFCLSFALSTFTLAWADDAKTPANTPYHPNFTLYTQAQRHAEAEDYQQALLNFSQIKPRESILLPLLLKFEKTKIFLKLKAYKSATTIYQTLPESKLKQHLRQQFLVELKDEAMPLQTFEFLSENIPEFQEEGKFLLLYLKNLKPGSSEYLKIVKRWWLVDNIANLQQYKDSNFKKYLKKIQDKATKEEWQLHFQQQFKRKNYRYLVSQITSFIKRQKQKKQPYTAASLVLVEAQFKLRRYAQLLTTLDQNPALFQPENAQVYRYKLHSYLARKQNKNADNFVKRVKKQKKLKTIANELTLAYARHKFYFERDYKKSLPLLQKVQLQSLEKKEQETAQWEKYYALQAVGNRSEAHEVYEWAFQHADFESSITGSSFCYWGIKYSKLHKVSGFKQKNPCFPKYSNHFYGFRSWKKFTEEPAIQFDLSQVKPPKNDPTSSARLEWLSFLYNGDQEQLADLLVRSIDIKEDKQSLVAITKLLHQHHRYYTAYLLGVQWFPNWDKELEESQAVLHAMYPLAYFSIIQKYAKRYKVHPYLVLAIIREESRFQPQVKSWAGAIGLMQIMPNTGKHLVRQMKIKPSSLSGNVDFNIHLGTFYIKQLLKRFKNNAVHALAGYNGGPGNVSRWIKRQKNSDIDYFIEDIPFKETRHYIKRVLRSYYAYSWLYPQEKPHPDLVH